MEENNETKTGKIMETNRCYDIDYGDDTYINVIRKPCGRNGREIRRRLRQKKKRQLKKK